MATDVEESDTDEHERPAPPKRQCTRLVGANDIYNNSSRRLNEPEERTNEAEECEYDEVERLARENLGRWQERQVATGCLQNTINQVMENYILNRPDSYSQDDSDFRLFPGTDMEDTAVLMAIHNHGLVHTTDMVSQSQALCGNRMSVRCDNHDDILRSCSSSRLPDGTASLSSLSLPSSSTIFEATRGAPEIVENPTRMDNWSEDRMDESDGEQDFLERAVAEAIKKKGLSALSVDYG